MKSRYKRGLITKIQNNKGYKLQINTNDQLPTKISTHKTPKHDYMYR